MSVKLVFVGKFETEFKEKKYIIYQFLHPNSMSIISGTNLDLKKELVPNEDYQCVIGIRANKIKVIDVLQ